MKRFLAIAACLVLAGCAPSQTTSTASSQPNTPAEQRSANQTLRYGQSALPASMSIETSELWRELYLLMYDPVLMMNGDHAIQPWAAEKWAAQGPNTWRITLRKDLTFSNGEKVTAADLEFTAKFVLENRTPPISQLGTLTEVKAVDDYTVDFTTCTADSSVLAGLAYLSIVPKKYFESVGRQGFVLKPIGSGPYELAEFKTNELARFKLRSTPHPFRKPVLTEITALSVPETSAAIAGLRTGDLDFVNLAFTPDELSVMEREGNVVHERLTGNTFVLIPPTEAEERKSPLTDKRVRQALNYAVDKESMSKTLYRGKAQPTGQLGPVGSPFLDPDIKPYQFDPAKAKSLLAEAGYPNGFTLSAGFDFNRSNTKPDSWIAIQGYLRDIGVNVELNGLEYGIYTERFRNLQPKGDLYASALYDTNGYNSTIKTYFGCQTPYPNNAGRVWYCNPEFDRLHLEAAAEPDLTKRGVILHKAAKLITDDVRAIFLLNLPSARVHSAKVRGFNWNEDRLWTFDSMYRVE